ncbi:MULTISPECIES: hypothetical protein [Rhizobiaceae]|uniref:hypothetical protein n=1 Tax=Rhizobiaceae TaxID=82115 RepID=UPI0013E35513|nr:MULTISPECIES: hypothetical protein [Rhizobiaceae]MBY3260238.1 hypothetical protein [Rhizobium laguerreae]MBY3335545.1 hypothetical protein [Rhizobium laguerreae]
MTNADQTRLDPVSYKSVDIDGHRLNLFDEGDHCRRRKQRSKFDLCGLYGIRFYDTCL